MTTGSGSLREAQKAQTRARIVDASRVVFEQHGYGGASIGLITSEASINRATFYLHFPHKAAVFREVVALDRLGNDAYWQELNAALQVGTRQAIEAWMHRMTSWARTNAALTAARHEAMASDPAFASELQPRFDLLVAELDGYLSGMPATHREHLKVTLQLLIVMLDGMFLQAWVQGVWSADEEQVLRAATDIWCSALGID